VRGQINTPNIWNMSDGDNRAASSDFAYIMEGLADGSKGSVVSIPYGQSAALILELKSADSASNSI